MNIIFQNIHAFVLLWIIPACIAGFIWTLIRRRIVLRRFVEAIFVRQNIANVSLWQEWIKAALFWTALALIIMAMARPGWPGKSETKPVRGRDVVFLLDVSKSMLAEDLAPNRLERAKSMIGDSLAQMEGNRLGLVAFAGSAVIKCPLTMDYGFFRMVLREISCDSISRGGTLLGNALQKTLDVFSKPMQKLDIILITDGDDHDHMTADIAKQLGEGRIIVIGLGDENTGRRIPTTNAIGKELYLQHQGKEVWSKMNSSVLREIAKASPNGRFFNVGAGVMDLGAVYHELTRQDEANEYQSKETAPFDEAFQYFLAATFLVLCFEFILSNRKYARAVSIIALLLWSCPGTMKAESINQLVDNGNKAYREKNYKSALIEYDKALTMDPESSILHFNRGAALYQIGDYAQAEKAFQQADQNSQNHSLNASSQLSQGNCAFKQAEQVRNANPKQAIALGEKSLRSMQKALAWDPSCKPAAENIEIIRNTIKAWSDEQAKKEQEERKKKDQAQQLQAMIERQKQAMQQNQNLKQEKQKKGETSDWKQKMNSLAQEQKQMSDQTRQMAQSMNQSAASQSQMNQPQKNSEPQNDSNENILSQASKEQESAAGKLGQKQQDANNDTKSNREQQSSESRTRSAQDKLSQASKEQESAAEKLGQNKQDAANEAQARALAQLEEALKQLGRKSSKNSTSQGTSPTPMTQNSSMPQPNDSENSRGNSNGSDNPAADQAQNILNEERQNRNARSIRKSSGYQTVEKDW